MRSLAGLFLVGLLVACAAPRASQIRCDQTLRPINPPAAVPARPPSGPAGTSEKGAPESKP